MKAFSKNDCFNAHPTLIIEFVCRRFNMAEQYNMQTGFIDGSGVYGPNEVNIVEEERGVD